MVPIQYCEGVWKQRAFYCTRLIVNDNKRLIKLIQFISQLYTIKRYF